MQPLANIVLKMTKWGSTVPKNNVTPAEVMFYVADHHHNTDGKPIVSCEVVEDKTKERLAAAKAKLDALKEQLEAFAGDEKITEETRERRMTRQLKLITSMEDSIEVIKQEVKLRSLTPLHERRRLSGLFGAKRVGKMFPGQIPNLPADFDEAIGAGLQTSAPTERFMVEADGGFTS